MVAGSACLVAAQRIQGTQQVAEEDQVDCLQVNTALACINLQISSLHTSHHHSTILQHIKAHRSNSSR